MTQSSKQAAPSRAVVIAVGDELMEVTRLLEELAVPTEVWKKPALPSPDALEGASLVVVQGRRLIDSGAPTLSLWPRTIAIVDDTSRTLAAHLKRLGVKLIVRRPIHARTLRLVLLHEIYRGPERRRKKRIPIGHPIQVGGGLFKQKGILLELSPGGARVQLPTEPRTGTVLKLLLGKDLTHARPLRLKAKVVRCARPCGAGGRAEAEIGVQLIDPRANEPAIRAILERFSRGPATWRGSSGETAAARAATSASDPTRSREAPGTNQPTARGEAPGGVERTSASAAPDDPGPSEEIDPESSARRLPPMRPFEQLPDTDPVPAAARAPTTAPARGDATEDAGPADGARADRRHHPRVAYEHRVVALDKQAARVLVGRDLSIGGLRIDATDAVEIDDVLKIALHAGDDTEPIVVVAHAAQYDGDTGFVLRFRELDDDRRRRLEELIEIASPLQSVPANVDPNEASGSFVVGEVLETLERSPRIETDEEVEAHLDAVFGTGATA